MLASTLATPFNELLGNHLEQMIFQAQGDNAEAFKIVLGYLKDNYGVLIDIKWIHITFGQLIRNLTALAWKADADCERRHESRDVL